MNDNYRINCSIDSLKLINIINQKSDICLNDKEYIMSTDSRFIQKNDIFIALKGRYSDGHNFCLLYTSPSPRDQRGSRMPSSA